MKENSIQGSTVSISTTVAIMSIFSLAMALGIIQAAMSKLFVFYGEQGIAMTTVMYAISITQLLSIAGGIVAGIFAGRLITFKTTAIIGIMLFIGGGTFPILMSDFNILIITRGIYGVGLGFIMVLGNPLISIHFSGDKKAKMLSIGSFVSFAGVMLLQLLGGFLADIELQYVYLAHLPALVPLVLVIFFIKKTPNELRIKTQINRKKNVKDKLSKRVFFVAITFGIASLCMMPLYINFSVLVAQINPQVKVATFVQILYAIGTMIGSASFLFLYRTAKRFTFGIYCILGSIGIALMLNVGNIPMMFLAMCIAGIGYGGFMPTSLMITGLVTKPEKVAFATMIVINTMNFLSFLVSPVSGIIEAVTGDAIISPMQTGALCMFLLGLVLFAINPFPGKHEGANF